MPLALIDTALRGIALALLVLLALLRLRDHPTSARTRIWVAFAVGLSVQVVSTAPAIEAVLPREAEALAVAISVGNGALFWVFVQALFEDDFRLRAGHVLAWCAAALLGAVRCLYDGDPQGSFIQAETIALRLAPLVFCVLAAVAAASQWRADLVEERRRMRVFVLVSGVAYTLAQVGLRLAGPQGRLEGTAALSDMTGLVAILAVVAWRSLRVVAAFDSSATAAGGPAASLAPQDAGAPASAAAAASATADEQLAGELQRLMREERAYRADGLSVATLAQRLGVPEYRLRRLINQRLGQRNFNAYVNGHRIEEARAVLADPARAGESIMEIALEAGFQSIGPFNRAFKALTGVTPSEFRRSQLADFENRPAESRNPPLSARRAAAGPAS